MDLLSVSPLASCQMALKHPTTGEELVGDDGQPIFFILAGADSSEFRNASRAIAQNRIGKGKLPEKTGDKEKDKEIARIWFEQADIDGISLLSACVLGWSGNFSIGGEKPVWSYDKARSLIESQAWIREQIDRFIGTRSNFLPKA